MLRSIDALFARLDADDSAFLTYDELVRGLKRLPIFKAAGIYLSHEDWEVTLHKTLSPTP